MWAYHIRFWTIICGPCMNNIKMRNSSNRDASLLKWWLSISCVWYVLYIILKLITWACLVNVSIKSLLIQPIPFPKAFVLCLFFVCSPAVTIALPFQICLLITSFFSILRWCLIMLWFAYVKKNRNSFMWNFYLCSW